MAFYDEAENVLKYIKMCEGYDGSHIYDCLQQFLPLKSTLLELGSGGGLDIDELKTHYLVTGSDLSEEFLKHCRLKHPKISFMQLDAHKIEMDNTSQFASIYSNKVLHLLSEQELSESLNRQIELLSENGLIAHSFWIGSENYNMNGMIHTYYTKERLYTLISESYEILASLSYQEFEQDDSLFIVAKKK